MSSFGVSSTGFVPLRQADCLTALKARAVQAFGPNVDLSPDEFLGQLLAIGSEREALLWAALQDVLTSATVNGAEGVFVDELLALLGLSRNVQAATRTNPAPDTQANGILLQGLVLYGTPGTTIPKGSIIQTTGTPALSFALDAPVTLQAATNAVQTLVLSRMPTAGSFVLGLTTPSGAVAQTQPIAYNALPQATQVMFSKVGASGTYALQFDAATTAPIDVNAAPTQIAQAIAALPGLEAVQVTATGTGKNYLVSLGSRYVPAISAIQVAAGTALSIVPSVQARIHAVLDPADNTQPFTDVSVTQASQQAMTVTFGGGTARTGAPASGARAQARMALTPQGLVAGNLLVNASVSQVTVGKPASAAGSATCTQSGPNIVPAGSLTVMGSSQAGWSAVNNQLDCIVGANTETDTQALTRRKRLLSVRGNGALPAVIDKVSAVADVSAVIGFENVTAAALQRLHFSAAPNGTFQLAIGGYVTDVLPQDCSAAQMQTALQALPAYDATLVTGSMAADFIIDFNGSQGGQAQPLIDPYNNATGVIITPSFARPPKSIEMVVQGGADAAIAQAIFAAAPAGIATYGRPLLQTTGSPLAGSTQITLASVVGLEAGMTLVGRGLAPGSAVVSLSDNVVTLNIGALSSYSNVGITATTQITVQDSQNNPHQIGFSRPIPSLIYVNLLLTTDYYNVPGNGGSGLNANAQFNPASLSDVQANIAAILQAIPIGGAVVAKGTHGLEGSFNENLGVLDYDLRFDVLPQPTNTSRIKLAAEQVLSVQLENISVSFQ